MLLRLVGWSTGAKVPGKKFGINGPSGVYLQTKVNASALHNLYGITKFMPNPNGASGAALMGFIATDWIRMGGENDGWIHDIDSLTGSILVVELSGTLVLKGTVDLKISILDENNDTSLLATKRLVKASGASVSGATVTGELLKFARSAQSIKAA